jgi:iron complex transport system substrate-binding protein
MSQRSGQTRERRLILRRAEAQNTFVPIEPAAPDVLHGKLFVDCQGIAMAHKPIERRTAGCREPGLLQDIIQRIGLLRQPSARGVGPSVVAQRGSADHQCRTGAGPRPESFFDLVRNWLRREREAEPQPGEAIKFSERAQNDHGISRAQADCADSWHNISEGFVDDEPAVALCDDACRARQRRKINDAAVGIVRIDQHDMPGLFGNSVDRLDSDDLVSAFAPTRSVFAIGRCDDRGGSIDGETWQPLDQRLGAGRSDNSDIIGHAVRGARGIEQRNFIGLCRQVLPDRIGQVVPNRPCARIDAGRKIEPRLARAAELRHCLRDIAAMFHAHVMPSSVRRGQCFALALLMSASGAAMAADLPKIASINLCTDQLLLALADPSQILGLSPYARDATRSWDAAKAAQFSKLSGNAEDVLILKPDIVVAGRFTKRATRELLKEKGLRVVEFDPARSIEDTKTQMRLMGEITGHADRGAAEIERLDAAIAQTRAVATQRKARVLVVSRRGWISGGESLTSSLLKAAGLGIAANDLGLKSGGFASLEAIVALKPDYLMVTDNSGFAEDEGSAFLLHPALELLYPPNKRITIPERLTVCGGPMLAEAMQRLASEIMRVVH